MDEKPIITEPTTNVKPMTKAEAGDELWLGLDFAWELGYTMAIPAVVFGFGGAYLDKHFHTSPFMTVGGLLIAFIASAVSVTKKIRKIIKRMPPIDPSLKKPTVSPALEKPITEGETFHDQFRPKP